MSVLPKNSGSRSARTRPPGGNRPRCCRRTPGCRGRTGPVIVERPILDGDGDLVVGLVRRELVVRLRRRPGEHGGRSGSAVEHGVVPVRATADEEEAGGAGVDVEPRHPECVIVVPDGRRPLIVGILGGREARPPRRAEPRGRLAGEELVPGALGRVADGDVTGSRQIPGLRVPVALVAHPDGAVHVRDHRHGAAVGARGLVEGGSRVAVLLASGWIRPVQRGVDRQQMGQVVALIVEQVVDPLDPHRPIPSRFDRERGRVVEQQPARAVRSHGTVAPYGGRRQAGREDLLRELPHRDLVVVDVLAAAGHESVRLRHDRRDEERRLELRHGGDRQRTPGHIRQSHPRAAREHGVEHETGPGDPAAAMKARRLISPSP